MNALAVKVMKGIYSPICHEYSRELRSLVDEMLSQNSKNRPSIFEILTRPFLFGKVQNYMRKIYNNKEKYDSELIDSLMEQAKTLGIVLTESKSKIEGTPKSTRQSKQETKYERNK